MRSDSLERNHAQQLGKSISAFYSSLKPKPARHGEPRLSVGG